MKYIIRESQKYKKKIPLTEREVQKDIPPSYFFFS